MERCPAVVFENPPTGGGQGIESKQQECGAEVYHDPNRFGGAYVCKKNGTHVFPGPPA